MAYPGAPNDGKSDVDRPFLVERQSQAKDAHDRANKPKPEKDAPAASRASGEEGKLPESINKNAPAPALNMEGNRGVQQHFAGQRLSKEAAAEKMKQDAARLAAKKIEKPAEKEHNNEKAQDKSQDKGRE